jgi:MFS family permease
MFKTHFNEYLSNIRLFSNNARWFLMGSFFIGFGYSVFWLLLNLYLKQLGFKEGTIGTILSAASLGNVLVAIPAAIIIDHVRIKRVLFVSAALNSSLLTMMVLSTQVWPIRILAGFSGAMFTVHGVVASPFFMRNSTPRERPYLFGINMALETLSGFVGTLIGGLIPTFLLTRGVALLYGYRYTLIGGAIVAVISLVFYAMIKAAKPVRQGRFRISEYFGARDWRIMISLTIPHFLVGMGAGLVIPFLNIYFLKRFSLESAAIGRIFSIGSLFTAIGFLIGPLMARRIGLVKTSVITQFLSIPFFLILAFSHNLILSVVAFFFRGSLMNMAWPMYNNFAMELVPENQQAGANSVMSLAWNMSWMFSASIGGYIIQQYGFTPVMLATVGLYMTSISSAWLIFRHKAHIGLASHVIMPTDSLSPAIGDKME